MFGDYFCYRSLVESVKDEEKKKHHLAPIQIKLQKNKQVYLPGYSLWNAYVQKMDVFPRKKTKMEILFGEGVLKEFGCEKKETIPLYFNPEDCHHCHFYLRASEDMDITIHYAIAPRNIAKYMDSVGNYYFRHLNIATRNGCVLSVSDVSKKEISLKEYFSRKSKPVNPCQHCDKSIRMKDYPSGIKIYKDLDDNSEDE